MSKWNLIVDVERCNNCNNCTLAVKDEHGGNAFAGYAAPQASKGAMWFKVERRERGQAPMVDAHHYAIGCMQCDNPPCVTDQTRDCFTKRDDGILLLDPVRSKGRKDIVGLCPYGQISWNEDLQIPQKWIFEAHLLDQGWKEPRVSQVCPTGALEAVKAGDAQMAERVKREGLIVLKPELGTKPRLYYKNASSLLSEFIGGTVFEVTGGVEDCVEDIEVRLRLDGELIASTKTDAFGDFKFDGLCAIGQSIALELGSGAGFHTPPAAAIFDHSLFLGAMRIERRI